MMNGAKKVKTRCKCCCCLIPTWICAKRDPRRQAQLVEEYEKEHGISTEHPFKGEFDESFGEWYKSMKVDKCQNSKEVLIFYSAWNSVRKIIYALMLVFFQNYPIL